MSTHLDICMSSVDIHICMSTIYVMNVNRRHTYVQMCWHSCQLSIEDSYQLIMSKCVDIVVSYQLKIVINWSCHITFLYQARLIQEQEEDLKRMVCKWVILVSFSLTNMWMSNILCWFSLFIQHHHIGAGIRFTVMLTS